MAFGGFIIFLVILISFIGNICDFFGEEEIPSTGDVDFDDCNYMMSISDRLIGFLIVFTPIVFIIGLIIHLKIIWYTILFMVILLSLSFYTNNKYGKKLEMLKKGFVFDGRKITLKSYNHYCYNEYLKRYGKNEIISNYYYEGVLISKVIDGYLTCENFYKELKEAEKKAAKDVKKYSRK
nr:hypothetical protein [uncultured Cohaesibacter sp.]